MKKQMGLRVDGDFFLNDNRDLSWETFIEKMESVGLSYTGKSIPMDEDGEIHPTADVQFIPADRGACKERRLKIGDVLIATNDCSFDKVTAEKEYAVTRIDEFSGYQMFYIENDAGEEIFPTTTSFIPKRIVASQEL